jgi:RNA polymerase sigma factor (TIGR02999 family)
MTTSKRPSAEFDRTDPDQIARLIGKLRLGSKDAAGQLVAIFYPELRRMARSRMRNERTPHTWQPTVLVNELYLELLKIKALNATEEHSSDREAFLGLAAHIMRRMLVHHARPLYRRAEAIDLSEELDLKTLSAADLPDIENLLARLSKIDPQLRTIVEMHVFEEFTISEIASYLNCASRTIDRRWHFARKWLEHQLTPESQQ